MNEVFVFLAVFNNADSFSCQKYRGFLAEGSISSFKNKINIVGSLISAYFLQVLD
jgi:hypothetical protein